MSADGSLKVWENSCYQNLLSYNGECLNSCPLGYIAEKKLCKRKLMSIYPYVISFLIIGLSIILLKIFRVRFLIKKNDLILFLD